MMTTSLSYIKLQMERLEGLMDRIVKQRKALISRVHHDQRIALTNLLRYLVLRTEDIRDLQDKLHIHGLSSMASAESHILSQMQAILQRLGKTYRSSELDPCTHDYSKKEIERKSEKLFGKKHDRGIPHIMVTFDGAFADQYDTIKKLLLQGMNVARINCAHDDEATWVKMLLHIKRASKETGLSCKIYMDLAGPKIRTQFLGKGKKEGRVKIREDELIWMADDTEKLNKKDIILGTTVKGIVPELKVGQQVLIDDGLIKGIIEKKTKHAAGLRILKIAGKKNILKAEKGINFPDSNLSIQAITDYDKVCLPFICKHADLVGYSFVRTPEDLAYLKQSLDAISSKPPCIIIKIETPDAVKNLPALLIRGMEQGVFGVMIARGDLAVEIGFERMGEIQEEILWICESAHTPVVWATQVLENLNKTGIATRSEITDVAHAAMAECVMINKGNHTIEVISVLKDILSRIGGHHIKKRFTFRPLKIASHYIGVT